LIGHGDSTLLPENITNDPSRPYNLEGGIPFIDDVLKVVDYIKKDHAQAKIIGVGLSKGAVALTLAEVWSLSLNEILLGFL
jgi:hypothetical protein